MTSLIILFPLLLIISILCFFIQGRPILFKQSRIGYNFKDFKIYKFRSMVKNEGNKITEPGDSRITCFGGFLRKTKIDELPQLINILRGEMRFIGPRPEVPEYFDKKRFKFLHRVKPGISDFCSIILRNESKILASMEMDEPYLKLLPVKLDLANYYAKEKSFLLDLKLVLITVVSILFPKFAVNKLAIPILKINSAETRNFLKKHILD